MPPGKYWNIPDFVVNAPPSFERGNDGQNCTYCNRISMVYVMWLIVIVVG